MTPSLIRWFNRWTKTLIPLPRRIRILWATRLRAPRIPPIWVRSTQQTPLGRRSLSWPCRSRTTSTPHPSPRVCKPSWLKQRPMLNPSCPTKSGMSSKSFRNSRATWMVLKASSTTRTLCSPWCSLHLLWAWCLKTTCLSKTTSRCKWWSSSPWWCSNSGLTWCLRV